LHMSFFCCIFARFLNNEYVYMREILIAIVFLLVAMALLSVGVLFRKDHSFRSQHIHQNKRMKQDGIHCSTAQDKEMRRDAKRKMKVKEL